MFCSPICFTVNYVLLLTFLLNFVWFLFLASTKRLHEYCNLASGVLAEELSHRRFSPSSASLIGSGSASPSSSGASMKKKTVSLLWGSFFILLLLYCLEYILV